MRETDRTPLLSGQGPGTPRRVPPQDHDDMMNAPLTHESTPRGGCELWQAGSGSRLVVNLKSTEGSKAERPRLKGYDGVPACTNVCVASIHDIFLPL